MVNLVYETKKTPPKNKKKQKKIFIASPSDVSSYRKITLSVISEINELYEKRDGEIKLHPYAWETSKIPQYTNDYQKDIFNEFGDWCDIFILILWHKIGEGGTEKEYTRMKEVFLKNNPEMKLIVAHIDKPISPTKINTRQLNRLREFVKNNENNWSLLGAERGVIKNKKIYEKLLRQELNYK